jgi:glucosamine-6-phosphate deaminase
MAAAEAVAAEIRRLIAERGLAVGIFSAEAEFLDHLAVVESIEWTRIIGFHTFELLGADEDAPQSQRKILLDHLVRQVPMAEFHGLRGEAANPEAVCANYAELLKTRPPDFAVLTIGQSGELEAIDSDICDFHDLSAVKLTASAITLTIPTLMACRSLFVLGVPALTEISEKHPASILRKHTNAYWYGAR